MRFNRLRLKLGGAFTILEAVISVALIGIATASAFQIIKIVSAGKYSLDDRHNIYLAAMSFSTNLDLALMEINSSDVQTINPGEILFTTGGSCPANNGNFFRDRIKNELCRTKFIVNPLRPQGTQQLRILVSNTVNVDRSIKYLDTRITFVHPTTGVILFEKVLLNVK